MKKIKEIGLILLLGISGLLLIVTFLFPLILSIITGNWWFLALFAVVGIPIFWEWLVFVFIFGILSE
jgi:hypothetical protein